MAATQTLTKNLSIGYWGESNLILLGNSPSELITISDSLVYRVIVKLAETVGIKDTSPIRHTIQDFIVLVEGISAWVKGAIKTLFISDDRYFRKRG